MHRRDFFVGLTASLILGPAAAVKANANKVDRLKSPEGWIRSTNIPDPISLTRNGLVECYKEIVLVTGSFGYLKNLSTEATIDPYTGADVAEVSHNIVFHFSEKHTKDIMRFGPDFTEAGLKKLSLVQQLFGHKAVFNTEATNIYAYPPDFDISNLT